MFKVSRPYATMLINYLRLFVVGDGSDGRHVCTETVLYSW